jgi:hypothetical protein
MQRHYLRLRVLGKFNRRGDARSLQRSASWGRLGRFSDSQSGQVGQSLDLAYLCPREQTRVVLAMSTIWHFLRRYVDMA